MNAIILNVWNKQRQYGSIFLLLFIFACKGKEDPAVTPVVPPVVVPTNPIVSVPVPLEQIADTYGSIADPALSAQWGPYNVHDPSIIHEGDYYYCYSTDVAYGFTVKPGLQFRRSQDLVVWEFRGWAFPEIPPKAIEYIKTNGGTPNNALWAPYIIKVGTKFRLYYSLASNVFRLSCIGMATSDSAEGPWNDVGIVVSTTTNGATQTNAIDPTILIDKNGNHYMYYGSAFDGIHMLKLDPTTGLALTAGDRGVRVAQRGFTGSSINGNIEAPEIIYNADFNKYYLFQSYDWLETKYNVRVGKADSPEGPFLDFNGVNMNEESDHGPMIVAPYRFGNHLGWQGTGHCAVFSGLSNRFYIAHQGRPAENKFFMDLHVRQIFWRDDGWPIVSPERYAAIENEPVTVDQLTGAWDRIVLNYTVVPGYQAEQTSADIQASVPISLDASGSINGDATNSWTFAYPKLTLTWSNGSVENLVVHRGRDWENKVVSTILFTGMDQSGTGVWGRKAH